MPIWLPIVSEFKSTGIDKAAREFKSLEGKADKAALGIKKAFLPASIAVAGIATGLIDATKAAAEDSAAAEKLANSIKQNTGATLDQVAAVEDFISKTSVSAAVADDELRPAFDSLVRGTKDITEAQDLLGLALDVSAGTGKDLTSVSDALAKAFNGNLGPLKKLDPSLAGLVENGADADEVMAALGETFGGAAATAAGTAEGKMKSLGIAMGEAKESIGQAVLPLAEKLLPKLTELANWISDNQGLVIGLAVGIGAIAGAIILANAAMSAWAAITAITAAVNTVLGASFSALWVATGVGVILAVIAALAILQVKFNIFGKAIDGIKWAASKLWEGIGRGIGWVKDLVIGVAQTWLNVYGSVFNAIAKAWNNTVGKIGFTVPDWIPLLGGKRFDVPDIPYFTVPQLSGGSGGGGSIAIPKMAAGGIVTSPTLALIGEAGPEAVIPLRKNLGTGAINITVNGALDPVAVARQIRELLRDEARRTGRTVLV